MPHRSEPFGKKQTTIYSSPNHLEAGPKIPSKQHSAIPKRRAHMTDVAGNWVLVLVFLPLWAVMAPLWFGMAICSKKAVFGHRTRKLIDSAAVALSLCSAGGIMLGLKCSSFMNLPLSEKVCYAAALQSNTWFEQSSYWFAHLGASFHS